MTFKKAKDIMRKNIDIMSIEDLQKHHVALIDIYQMASGRYGYNNEFFKAMFDDAAEGYTPRDMFMITNLNYLLDKVEEKLNKFYQSK